MRISTTRPAGSTFDALTSSSTAADAEARLGLLARAALADLLVDVARAARRACRTRTPLCAKLVVERRQDLLVQLLQRDGAAARACRRRAPRRPRSVSPASEAADRRSRSRRRGARRRARRRSRAGPGPSSETMSTTATSPSARGAPVDRRELGDRPLQALELLRRRPRPEPRPRASAPRASSSRPARGRLHRRTRRVKRQSSLAARRQLVVVVGLLGRAHAVRARRAPEPAADVRLDRLACRRAACRSARRAPACGTLPGAEAGDLDAVGEVVRRVLDRVMDVARPAPRPSGGRGRRRAARPGPP